MNPPDPHESLHSALAQVVGNEHVSPEGQHFHVHPGTASEVSQLVIIAKENNATIVPVGKAGRSTPTDDLRPQLLLNMRRMDHILHLDEISLVVHVQAGLSGLDLETALNQRGLTIGDFPPAALGSTIGGLLSVRTPGKSARRHGTFEDSVLGVSAVMSDGRNLHTRVAPRRATGPDLSRVLCGSEGALGIITSAELRIYHLPESRLLAAYLLPNFEEALTAVRLALREEASPAAMRIYDQAEATRHLGECCGEGEAIMVVATVGPTSLAACDRDLIASAVEAVGGRPTDERVAATWWRRRTGHEQSEREPPSPNLQVSATPRKLAPVYEAICRHAQELGLKAQAHGSRFDRDGGVLFVSVRNSEGRMLPRDSSELRTLGSKAEDAGAYLLVHNAAALPTYFEYLRDVLDPGRHLNPGVLR